MNAPARKRPEDRRMNETREFVTPEGHTAYVTVGYDPSAPLKPVEVFYSGGFKSGCALECHIHDTCVLISVLLQMGASATNPTPPISRRATAHGGEDYASLAGGLLSVVNEPPSWTNEYLTSIGAAQQTSPETSTDAKEKSE